MCSSRFLAESEKLFLFSTSFVVLPPGKLGSAKITLSDVNKKKFIAIKNLRIFTS